MRDVAVALLAVALAGCQTAQKVLEIGQDVYTSIEALKAAEKA
jgi:predicted small secreted protein